MDKESHDIPLDVDDGIINYLKAKCERYEEALVEIKKKADHGWPKDVAVGTKSGTACIQIYNIADEALSAGEGGKGRRS